ncbi:hypothetical protein BBP40_006526 [Aspergillus hancockii]|nr:hypothetical protein BBP40_006526 [Aspergillus hancockii]
MSRRYSHTPNETLVCDFRNKSYPVMSGPFAWLASNFDPIPLNHAPTTTFKPSNEPPVTYLNKPQAYSMTVVDLFSSSIISTTALYRTSLWVTFEEERTDSTQQLAGSFGRMFVA